MTGFYELWQVYELRLSVSGKGSGILSLEQSMLKCYSYVKQTFPLLS